MIKNFAKRWGRVLFYPVARTATDLSESAGRTREIVGQINELRAMRKADSVAASQYLEGLTPSEKFQTVSELNEWSEKELIDQEVAVRRTRIAVLMFAVFGFILMLGTILFMPTETTLSRILIHFMLPVASILFLATCGGLAIRYAWWEHQLHHRALIPMRQYLAQGSLFLRLLS